MTRTRHLLPTLLAILAAACSQQAEPESESLAFMAPPLPPAVAVPRAPFFAPPFTYDDQAVVDEDSFVLIDALANDVETQLAIDPESILVVTDPQDGTALIGRSGLILYIPDPNFHGTDSFQYTVDNIAGQTSNTATCAITINAVCDAPVAADDIATTDTNGAVTIDFTANDSDPDGPVQVASFQLISPPAGGAATFDPVTETLAYQANLGYQGDDTFSCQYTDDCGADSNPFDVTVHVIVMEPPSDLSYPTNPGLYPAGIEIEPNIPTVTGSVESFTSTPALPSGLILNPLTGAISGTPTAETPLIGYLITAANSGGVDTEILPIQITEGPGPTAGSTGSYQSSTGPDIPGPFFVDSNFRGASNSLQIVQISWGRLVDIADNTGVIRHRDFVVNEGVQSDGSYLVDTNPITDKTTVTINHTYESASYLSALDQLDNSLGTIFDKSLDVTELPPFPLMPRNAALMIQFNDLLDIRYEEGNWEDSSQGLLVASSGQLSPDIIRVLTGYMPTTPFEARIIASPNFGDLAHYNGNPGQEFHTTRVIIDMTISELDAAISDPPLAVNSIGLPPSILGVTAPNLALRLATQTDPLSGQAVVLTNPTGHALDFYGNGSSDSSTSTQDIVRAMRTGSSSDANNGFLEDSVAPQIIGSLTVDLQGSVIEVGNPGDGLYQISLTQFTPPACAPSNLKFGTDVLVQQGVRAILMSGVQSGPTVTFLTVQVISPVDGVIQLGDAQIQTPYNSVTDVPDCFLRFSPNAGSPPTSDVSKNAQVLVRFSEPMDPASLQPFDNMTLTRLDIEDPNLLPLDYVVGSVQPSADLREFSFVPSLPLDRSIVPEYKFALSIGDAIPTDLSGNALDIDNLFKVDFSLNAAESTSISRGFVLRFAEVNQIVHNFDDEVNNWPEFRDAQLIYDLNAEVIRPRPVTHYSVAADRDKPIPSAMTPFPAGVQTPLSPLGSKLQTLWRYCDLGFSLDDETNMNVDVEGLAWAPAGGSIVSDAYDEFEVRVAHSGWLPDELLDPNSGFPLHPQSGLNTVYSTNLMDSTEDPGTVIHSREKGYVVNPGDLFIGQGNGTNMIPFPVNQDVPVDEYIYYTWRDTSLLAVGGNNGAGVILDIEDSVLFGGAGPAKTYLPNNVPSVGLPLLMEFRCYVDTGALGLNAFDISLAVNSSARPNFRAFSTGGYNSNTDPVFKDPDLEDAADGGYNPNSNPPGAATPGVDNSFYIGQVDLVTRVSRSHSIWFDSGLTNPNYQPPVVEPAPEDLPSGTSVVINYRGATVTSIGATDNDTILTNPANINIYGEQDGGAGTINFLNGDSSWKESISEINSAQFFQLRMTFISNAATDQTPWLSTLAFAYGE